MAAGQAGEPGRERCAARARGAGLMARAGPGCHRAAAEGRGHTHPGLPSPPVRLRRPRGRVGGRPGPRSSSRPPVARALGPGVLPAPGLGLPASPGAAADILRRAGGGERNR